MARLPIITDEQADKKTKQLFDGIAAKFGMVPNIFRGMANSPAALQAYLNLDALVTAGSFTPVEQDIVRMVVSQANRCDYCVAAHTIGLTSKGMAAEEILNVRRSNAADPKHAALIDFTVKVIETKGFVSDGDLEAFKNAGFSDVHAAEIAVIIAQKTLSNYFNHINATDLDLPAAPEL